MDLLFKDVIIEYQTILYDNKCPINTSNNYNDNNDDDLFGIFTDRQDEIKTPFNYLTQYTDKDSYEKHIKNQLASVTSHTKTVVVEKNDEKISLKFFYNSFSRRRGSKWFKKHKKMVFITYRFKDGAVFYGEMVNYHKKRNFSKRLVRFTFGSQDIINEFHHRTIRFYENSFDGLKLKDRSFNKYQPVNVFIENVPGVEKYNNIPNKERFYRVFLDKNNVKYSNNFMSFVSIYHPSLTKKILKNHDNKMIDGIMEIRGLRGGKIRRVLHQITDYFSTELYFSLCRLYGMKKIVELPDDILKIILTQQMTIGVHKLPENFTEKEINNSLKIFTQVLDGVIGYSEFKDHFRFYKLVKKYENIKWVSQDEESFIDEHIILSNKYANYTSGNFERIYPSEFLDHIQQPIKGFVNNFYPVILTNSEMYNTESSVQSNCVRNYIRNANALIISLRLGSHDSFRRTTIEYCITYHEKRGLELRRVQTKDKRNQNVTDPEVIGVIEKLDDIVNRSVNMTLFDSYSIKVIPKIGSTKETEFKTIPFQRGGYTDYRITWKDESIIYEVKSYDDELLFLD